MPNKADSSNPETYVGYLEKEMTIMGVLSAFCIGSIALLLEKVIFATDGRLLLHWPETKCYIFAGGSLIFAASFLFYIQRSDLAYLYGQICLGVYRRDDTVESRINEADSWENWAPYQQAFTCLSFAGVEMILAAIQIKMKWFSGITIVLSSAAPILLALLLCCVLRLALKIGDNSDSDDHPYWAFVKGLSSGFKK